MGGSIDFLHLAAFQLGGGIGFHPFGLHRQHLGFDFGTENDLVIFIVNNITICCEIFLRHHQLVILTGV